MPNTSPGPGSSHPPKSLRYSGRSPRTFDPVRLGQLEAAGWAGYYRREWLDCLRAFIGMVSVGFGMNRRRTLAGAWWVLRANQAWAPYPDNDPDAARGYMRRFYALVRADGRLRLDPARAARLEVEWWRLHRLRQRADVAGVDALVESLVDLYSYVYAADRSDVRAAAEHRVAAMDLSDAWVRGGTRLDDPLLAEERRQLVASYTALRRAVGRDVAGHGRDDGSHDRDSRAARDDAVRARLADRSCASHAAEQPRPGGR